MRPIAIPAWREIGALVRYVRLGPGGLLPIHTNIFTKPKSWIWRRRQQLLLILTTTFHQTKPKWWCVLNTENLSTDSLEIKGTRFIISTIIRSTLHFSQNLEPRAPGYCWDACYIIEVPASCWAFPCPIMLKPKHLSNSQTNHLAVLQSSWRAISVHRRSCTGVHSMGGEAINTFC